MRDREAIDIDRLVDPLAPQEALDDLPSPTIADM